MTFIQSNDLGRDPPKILITGRTDAKMNYLLKSLHNLASEMGSGK